MAQVQSFATIPLNISDFATRHPYGFGPWQNHIERILAGWVEDLAVPIYHRREVTGFAQDGTGVDGVPAPRAAAPDPPDARGSRA